MIIKSKKTRNMAGSRLAAESRWRNRNMLSSSPPEVFDVRLAGATSRRGRCRCADNRRGFTLIEIMVVIIILGILAMYVAPKLMGRPEEAKQVRAKMDIAALETALKLYKLDSGMYPSSEQGLQALVQRPESGVVPKKWRQGGYLEKGKVPKDPWGNDYVYLSPGLKGDFDILSYGADGVPGGENENKDITNWDVE
jgi:general secretion pathway protein G